MKKVWMRISLHALIIGGLIAFFYGLVLAPQKRMVEGFNKKISGKIVEIEESLGVLDEITGEGGEVAVLRAEVMELKSRFITWDLLGEVAMDLVDWARKAGLEPVRVIPPIQGVEAGTEIVFRNGVRIVEMPIVIEMEGQFLAYGEFLESLTEFPHYIMPGGVWLRSAGPGKPKLRIGSEFFIYIIEEGTGDEVRKGS
jgi:hypothetical protein